MLYFNKKNGRKDPMSKNTLNRFRLANAFQLKLLMTILMLLDHLRFTNLVSDDLTNIFSIVSRCAAPMFSFFAVEGIRHSRNLRKYCLRLCLWAAFMAAGNEILRRIFFHLYGSPDKNIRLLLSNNIFFTLALGVCAITFAKKGQEKHAHGNNSALPYILSSVLFIVGFLYGEWGSVLLPFMFIEYFFSGKAKIRLLGYALIEVTALLLPFGEPLWFLALPFTLLYNGERGPRTRLSKYFFYVFYPAHLWLIALINLILLPHS